MAQSDERVPRRTGEPRLPRRSGPPPSFGRKVDPEPVEVPVAVPVFGGLPFSVVDGKLVVEVGARLVMDQESVQAFYDEIRQLTVLAVSDGLSTVMGRRPDDAAAAGGEDQADVGAGEPAAGDGS